MKLLDDLIEHTVDANTDLGTVLRKCLILAYGLKNEELKNWTSKELNGYDEQDDLPTYRVIGTRSTGTFVGIAKVLHHQPIATSNMLPQHAELVAIAQLRQPIQAYQHFGTTEDYGLPWSAELAAHYQHEFIEGMTLSRANQVIPRSVITGLGEIVRNKVLFFTLQIREKIGTDVDKFDEQARSKAQQIVLNVIYGGQNVIGSSVRNVKQAW